MGEEEVRAEIVHKGYMTTLSFTGCVLLMVAGVSKRCCHNVSQEHVHMQQDPPKKQTNKKRGGATP